MNLFTRIKSLLVHPVILTYQEQVCLNLILNYMKSHDELRLSPSPFACDDNSIYGNFVHKVRVYVMKSELKSLGYDLKVIEEDTYDRYIIRRIHG